MQKYERSFFFAGAIVIALVGYSVCCVKAATDETNTQSEAKSNKVNLTIHINVPHNMRAVDSCRVYPYPVAPPRQKHPIAPLSTKSKEIQNQLQGLGYSTMSRVEKAYPSGGWRQQYAFRAAEAKSGEGLPHTVFTMYAWREAMEPYMRTEIIRINAIEKDRKERYEAAQQIFDEHRTDMEVQAFNDGLFPQDVLLRPWHGNKKSGKISLDETNWWIVALHKTPGLQYYWLWPVKLSNAPEQLVELNEDNAIVIDGGW